MLVFQKLHDTLIYTVYKFQYLRTMIFNKMTNEKEIMQLISSLKMTSTDVIIYRMKFNTYFSILLYTASRHG